MVDRLPPDGPNTLLTAVSVPTPERFGDLLAAPKEAVQGTCGQVPGLRRGRFYRSVDGKSTLLVSEFATQEDFERFLGSMLFTTRPDVDAA